VEAGRHGVHERARVEVQREPGQAGNDGRRPDFGTGVPVAEVLPAQAVSIKSKKLDIGSMSRIFDFVSCKSVLCEESPPMNASFEEKSVWITLLGMVAVFGGYFTIAARMLAAGVREMPAFVALFAVATALLVIVLVAAHVAVAIASRPEGRDERDRLISWRAEHNSSWVLGVGVVSAIFALATPLDRVWVAHGLLVSLFLAEVASHVLQLYYYRRGM
jgi:hypothetical protein